MEICIKCGNSDKISIEYQPKGKEEYYDRPVDKVEQFMRDDSYYLIDKVRQEHLIYTCDVCGYKVATKCKDSK